MTDQSPYIRRVQYYETDKMAIVHHSNYIRWFEEARDLYVERNGISYPEIESRGILMPVISVECRYKTPARYGDTVEIYTHLRRFNGVRAAYAYEIYLSGGNTLVVSGESEHCFIDADSRRPVNLKRILPEICEKMFPLLEADDGGKKK